jgi:hypothetical protein
VAQAQQLPNVQMDDDDDGGGTLHLSIHLSIHPSIHSFFSLFSSRDDQSRTSLPFYFQTIMKRPICWLFSLRFQVNFAPFDRLPPNLIVENDSTFHQFL